MFFPVMVDLSAMEVLVVGGRRIACRKVKKLLEFGGRVKVIAPEFCKELYSLAQSMDEGKSLTMISRAFEVTDLEGQDLVYLPPTTKTSMADKSTITGKNIATSFTHIFLIYIIYKNSNKYQYY